jgi:teichuronic acid biosynthesis glycosyltransferase TuaG
MTPPLVSILMPAYNAEMYISRSIKSVVEQTYQNWELLIVDDASLDNTKKIINRYTRQDIRIKAIFSEKNSTKPSIAKNIALKEASGAYIAFLDSDDMWRKDKLEIQVEFLQANEEIGLVYSGGYWIDSYDNVIKRFMPKYECGNNLHHQLRKYEINNQSVVIKKETLETAIRSFNEKITIGEDYNLFMHIIALYASGSIKERLIYYRIHGNAITKAKKQHSDGVLMTLKELNEKYGIKTKYPFSYFLTYIKAIRFKYLKKNWK